MRPTRTPTATPAQPPPIPPSARGLGEPRPQHFEMAHRMLPIFTFRNPDLMAEQLSSGQSVLFLESIWRTVGKDVSRRGLPSFEARFRAPIRRSLDGNALWLVEMPPAAGPREAAWIGVLQRGRQVMYFTLEVGTRLAPTDPAYHVVCEWKPNGFAASPSRWTHWYSGLRCAPEPEAFSAAIAVAVALARPVS